MKGFFNKIVSTMKDIDAKVEQISNAYQESTSFHKAYDKMDLLR